MPGLTIHFLPKRQKGLQNAMLSGMYETVRFLAGKALICIFPRKAPTISFHDSTSKTPVGIPTGVFYDAVLPLRLRFFPLLETRQ